jgi:hypothetical protein
LRYGTVWGAVELVSLIGKLWKGLMTSWSLRVAAFVAGPIALSCSVVTPTTHILLGNSYDSVDDCLNPQQGFDVVDGPYPNGNCPVVCITDAKTGTAYVTNVCPPYPVLDSVEDGGDAGGVDECTAALAAWNAGIECGESSDAAADASDAAGDDAGDDSTTEGGADATLD